MPKTRHLEIQGSDLRQAAPALFQILVPDAVAKAQHVARSVSRKKYPTVRRPQKRELAGAMTWHVNRADAAGNG
ncbi:MAG: hypothetical protein ACE5F6_09905 [Anaerolineae bacterium]